MERMTPAEYQLYQAIADRASQTDDGVCTNLMLTIQDIEWDYGMAYRYMLRLGRRFIGYDRQGHGRKLRMWIKKD